MGTSPWIGIALVACCAAAAPLVGGDERALRAERAELAKRLRDPAPRTRRSAVRELARLGGRDDWLLVLGALEDRESEVADEAQLRLGELGDAELLRSLYGRAGLEAREPLVQRRAAEVLGRVPLQVDGEALAKRLSPREPELSRLLAWSLERQARAQRLGGRPERIAAELDSLRRRARDGDLGAAALAALAAVDLDGARRAATEAIADREGALRCAALQVAAEAGWGETFGWARASAADGETRVRLQALEVLAGLATRAALGVLVERLEREDRPALKAHAVDTLQRLTGMRYRTDPRPWRLWLERQPPDWQPGHAALPPAERQEGEVTVARKLEGLPVLAERLAFLFDFSGSMWTPLADGRTPKEIVARSLRDALEGLDREARFNVVPFTYDPLPWEERLVQARPGDVRRALDYFERCNARGRGNFHGAAVLALSDPDVERIVTLTDGVPTGGEHSDMDLIVPLLLERNRFRKVAFDAVLVDAPRGARRRWQELADATGGRLFEVVLQ